MASQSSKLFLQDARHLQLSYNFLKTFLPSSTQLLPQEPVCQNPAPFPTVAPTSHPLTMPLEAETKTVVSQFDLSDKDVNAATLEFLRQAGKFSEEPAGLRDNHV